MKNAQRKELAAKLHSANVAVTDAKRNCLIDDDAYTYLNTASALVKEVIEALMDAPGMIDYYGNPTHRES